MKKWVIYSSTEKVRKKLKCLHETHPDNIKLIIDFDQTITRGEDGASWYWIRNSPELIDVWGYYSKYSIESDKLYHQYGKVIEWQNLSEEKKVRMQKNGSLST